MLQEEIKERISKISKICRPLTNCYSMQLCEIARSVWSFEESFIFSYDDHGVPRLIFFVKDTTALDSLLRNLPKADFCIDVTSKDPLKISSVFEKNGFLPIAKMKRLVNADCRDLVQNTPILLHRDGTPFSTATFDDVHDINLLLWNTFDTRVSRLLNDAELKSVVEKGCVMIHRGDSGKVDSILQLDVMPKKFYVNQVINLSGTPVVHSMMIDALKKYVEQGGKYIYAWVEEKNIASLKFHSKYGMNHDGMWNLVYSTKR